MQMRNAIAEQPLAHCYAACSHNSYIVGDQLTGRSSSDMYRRQLLQGCRHIEIDCWDGRREVARVTHGHTFCTSIPFPDVAKALFDTAFVTSDLPVLVSLEMHCSPSQQRTLAESLVEHLSGFLMPYSELEATKQPISLSPIDLLRRVLPQR